MAERTVAGYFSAKETIQAASKNNQTVTEYLEKLTHVPESSDWSKLQTHYMAFRKQ